jgi:hypothetical protein
MLAQGDVRINTGRLRAKVLVFRTTRDLNHFWQKVLRKGHLGRRCLGAVQSLSYCTLRYDKAGTLTRHTLDVDRRYFCVIGLVTGHLSMRVITHEAVHAAYCFNARSSRNFWHRHAERFHEEAMAYPVGEIASAIVNFLLRAKMLDAGSATEPKHRP